MDSKKIKIPDDVRDYLMEAYQLSGQWSLPGNRGNYETGEGVEIKKTAVIGGGTMGRGIAISLCLAGYGVVIVENNQKAADWCKNELEITYTREKELKRLNDSKIEKLRSTIDITTDFQKLDSCDLIIEAVFENMKLKKELFTKLDKICKSSCVFGTNTSSLDIDEMSSVLKDPSRLVGIHFFNPANLIKVVEIVYGSKTSQNSVATAFEACKAMKKLPILVGNCPAFVFNRLLAIYLNQSHKLMYQYGLFPDKIDKIMKKFGLLMGPLTMSDMNGLDVGEKFKIEQGYPLNPVEERLLKLKRYGRKSNKGFYKYDETTHKKSTDLEVENIIREVSKLENPNIKISSDEELVDFLLFPMVNEGFLCIEEGIIEHESLIDIMLLLGFGWPPAQGGPMKFGRTYGIEKVAEKMKSWNSIEPEDRAYKLSNALITKTVSKL